jgi:tRNA 2-selenouridine synthase
LTADEFWLKGRTKPILDVRSPGEFCIGHIPGAINVPLFNDAQRAEVGTAYHHQGRAVAIKMGVQIVSSKLPELIEAGLAAARHGELLVHCWRGGMRSRSLAQFYQMVDLKPQVLEGGYKAFRKHARQQFELPYDLRVISGLTGVGKTHVLHALAKQGEQVVDLEALANHRGSSFGGIGMPPQPSTEQFENLLFEKLVACDRSRPIWVEDEGLRIGTVTVPKDFYDQYRPAPAVFIECSRQTRLTNLLHDYGDLPPESLIAGIERIAKRMDGKLVKTAVESVSTGDYSLAIEIVLDYYDKTYERAKSKIPRQTFVPLTSDGQDANQLAEVIRTLVF